MNDNWKVCTIEDLGEINRGRSKHRPRNDEILFGGDYPFIQTAEVKNSNLYITEYKETYNDTGLRQSKMWKKGTLCITIAANIAETAILGIDACFPDSVVGFIPYPGVSNVKYVKYMMDMFKLYMQQISRGTTQDNLSLEKIRKVKFEAPEYEEQCRIAETLSLYDDLIELNSKRIKLLEQTAQEIYKEWFVRFRFPGYEKAKFKHAVPKGWVFGEEENSKIPDNWYYGELKELGEFVRGKNITADNMVEGDVPVISAGIEPSGYHNQANVNGYSITMSASGANAGYLKYNLEDIWCADCSYYQNEDNIWYVYNALRFIESVINNLQVGSAQPHVYPKHSNRLSIPIPSEDLIKRYNRICVPIYNNIRCLQEINKNTIKQRDYLLPRLMSGKIEV